MESIEITDEMEKIIVQKWANAMKEAYEYRGNPDRYVYSNFLDGMEYTLNILLPAKTRRHLKEQAAIVSGVPSKYTGINLKFR